MADGIKISELPAAESAAAEDVVAGVQNNTNTTKKFSLATILAYLQSAFTIGSGTKTALTGILKGNGTTVGTATAGTDYQAAITAQGVLVGAGSGSVSSKTLDDSTLTNDNNHIPTSGVVYAALDALGAGSSNAGYHNCIYRGKALGSSVTAAQQSEIAAGTFADLFIGDYWTINDVNWIIAHFDYWRKSSYTSSYRNHHVVIVPESSLATGKMNAAATTEGGYLGSDFCTGNNDNTAKADITAIIKSAFGETNLLSYYGLFTNAVTDGKASGAVNDWHTVELMSECMVFGASVYGNPVYEVGTDWGQLALFRHNRAAAAILSRSCWLRTVAGAEAFALVNYNARAFADNANASTRGFRPVFAIQYG